MSQNDRRLAEVSDPEGRPVVLFARTWEGKSPVTTRSCGSISMGCLPPSPGPTIWRQTRERSVGAIAVDRIVGLTVVGARWLLDRDGRLTLTIPETVEASAEELAPALATA